MNILHFLQQRSSAAKLQAPAPNAYEREQIFQAALRAPDHGRMQPWRFLEIEGAGRNKLGDLFAKALQIKDPAIAQEKLDDIRSKPLRAPLIIAVIAVMKENPKVPMLEQQFSAACAAYSVLLASDALGYGGIWRTGPMVEDAHVLAGLGLAANEQLIGFLYIGSRQLEKKSQAAGDVASFVRHWP